MGTTAEVLAAVAPCLCGSTDLVIRDFYEPEGRVLRAKCMSCGSEVSGCSIDELKARWTQVNDVSDER